MATAHVDAAAAVVHKLYETGEFSDLLIRCRGQEFRVHRAIEAFSGEIELDDDPDSVSRMLRYIYTSNYEDSKLAPGLPKASVKAVDVTKTSTTSAASTLDLAAKTTSGIRNLEWLTLKNNALVYAVADKCNIPLLKDLAKEKFTRRANYLWPPAGLSSVLRSVYLTTPDKDRGLRTVVIGLCTQHLSELIASKDFRACVPKLSSFTFDLLQACLVKYLGVKDFLLEEIELYDDVAEPSLDLAASMSDDKPEPDDGPASERITQACRVSRSLMEQSLKNNALVYAAADKYHIPLLKDLAKEKFTARARSALGICRTWSW
ncbi:MAG: hypothetical protein M1826_007198 [Phylliscum demangeonii]|nr:MAG: hypothetical protein M1826_007198 [Phylliscum demangeonii]